jgi:hypothetical protein
VLAAPKESVFGLVEFNAPEFPTDNIPALTITPPLKVFDAERVHVPAPSFIKEPEPVPIIPDTEPPVEPPSVKSNAPVMLLVIPIDPEFATIFDADARTTAPGYVTFVAEEFERAPPLETPVPFKVRLSFAVSVKPLRSRVAPLVTVVPAATVPRGVFAPDPAEPNLKVPAVIEVAPV